MIRKLAHLNFVTNDLEKIIDFYVDKLGMKVKFTLDNKEGKPFGYYFACGDTTFLEFFDQKMASEVWGGNVEELNIGTRYGFQLAGQAASLRLQAQNVLDNNDVGTAAPYAMPARVAPSARPMWKDSSTMAASGTPHGGMLALWAQGDDVPCRRSLKSESSSQRSFL